MGAPDDDRASKDAARAQFHRDLAESQWTALAAALDAAPSAPLGTSTHRSTVKSFVARWGARPGSAPFLRGYRALMEAQGGKTHAVAWRVDPAVLTQSGGEEWMRDAVRLLAVGCHRRRDLEGPIRASGDDDDDDRDATRNRSLAWSLPLDVSDVDLYKLLRALPTHERLRDAGLPSGELVEDASRPGDAPRNAEPPGSVGRTASRRWGSEDTCAACSSSSPRCAPWPSRFDDGSMTNEGFFFSRSSPMHSDTQTRARPARDANPPAFTRRTRRTPPLAILFRARRTAR